MRLLPWTIACCLLSACAAGPPPMPVPQMPALPPATLTAPPRPLPPPASGRMRDLESNHRAVARQYHRLANQLCLLLEHLEVAHEQCATFLGAERAPQPEAR